MSITSITSVRTLDDIEALLDRLDPAVDAFCAVPGCVHHAAREHSDATWVGATLAAAERQSANDVIDAAFAPSRSTAIAVLRSVAVSASARGTRT